MFLCKCFCHGFCCCFCLPCYICLRSVQKGSKKSSKNPERHPLLGPTPHTKVSSNDGYVIARKYNNIQPMKTSHQISPKEPPLTTIEVTEQEIKSESAPKLEDFGLVSFKSGYFLYGGAFNKTKFSKSEVQNSLYYFDPYTSEFEVIQHSPQQIPGRTGHTTFLRKNRYIVVFGGLTKQKKVQSNQNNQNKNNNIVKSKYDPNLYEYDIFTKKWKVIKFRPMYSKIKEDDDEEENDEEEEEEDKKLLQTKLNAAPQLFHHTSVYASIKDEMYVFGGRSGYTQMNRLFRYSFQVQRWKELVFLKKSEIPEPRDRHSMNWLNNEETEFLIFGGMTNSFAPTNDLWMFSLPNKKWSSLTSKCSGLPPSSRYSHSSIIHNNRLFIYGGENKSDIYNHVYELNLTTFQWKQYFNNNNNSILPEIGHHKITFFENNFGNLRLLSIGGCDRKKTIGKVYELNFFDSIERLEQKRFLFLLGYKKIKNKNNNNNNKIRKIHDGIFFNTELHLPGKERIRCFKSMFASSYLKLESIDQITVSHNSLYLTETLFLSVLLGFDEIRSDSLFLKDLIHSEFTEEDISNLTFISNNNNNNEEEEEEEEEEGEEEELQIISSPINENNFGNKNENEEVFKNQDILIEIKKNNENKINNNNKGTSLNYIIPKKINKNKKIKKKIDIKKILSNSNNNNIDDDDELNDRNNYPPSIYYFDLFLFFRQFEMNNIYMELILKRVRELKNIPTLLKLFQNSLEETRRRKKIILNNKSNNSSQNNNNNNKIKNMEIIDMEYLIQSKFSINVFEAIKEKYFEIREDPVYSEFLKKLNYFEEMEEFLLSSQQQKNLNNSSNNLESLDNIDHKNNNKNNNKNNKSESLNFIFKKKKLSLIDEEYQEELKNNNLKPKDSFKNLFLFNSRILYNSKFKYFNIKLIPFFNNHSNNNSNNKFNFIKGHFEILILKSNYFYRLFKKNLKNLEDHRRLIIEKNLDPNEEENMFQIRIKEINSVILTLFLKWIYCNEIYNLKEIYNNNNNEEKKNEKKNILNINFFLLLRFSEQFKELKLRNYLIDILDFIILKKEGSKSFLKNKIIKKFGYFFYSNNSINRSNSSEFNNNLKNNLILNKKKNEENNKNNKNYQSIVSIPTTFEKKENIIVDYIDPKNKKKLKNNNNKKLLLLKKNNQQQQLLSDSTIEYFLNLWEFYFKISRKKLIKGMKKSKKKIRK